MDRARKMVAIPQETYDRLQKSENNGLPKASLPSVPQTTNSNVEAGNKNSVQTPGDNLSRLDQEMFDILNSKNFASNEEKCLRYLQILRRYLFFKDSEKVEEKEALAREIVESAPLTEETIIENVPKVHALKARLLLKHWRTYDPARLKWDNTGRVIIDGKVIDDSNIVELLMDVMKKPGKDADVPAGRYPFAMFVGTSDTPKKLVGNPEVLRIAEMTRGAVHFAKRPAPEPVFTPPLTRKGARKKWLQLA